MRTLSTLVIALVAASQLGATDCGKIIQDPGFDHWCGDQLCYWKLERGAIERVPTWHDGDDGAELIGDDVAISQVTAVTSDDTHCIRFAMLADVEETAEVRLEADVFDDGTVDWSERIPTSSWEKVTFRIGLRGSYEGIKFRITKVGSGHATLAQIGADVPDEGGCPSFVDITARPLGARCTLDTDCAGGICEEYVCSACRDDAACATGEVCGREDHAPGGRVDWHTCVAAASRAIGELCFAASECASGACDGGFCGECGGSVVCDGGAACEPVAGASIQMCDTGARALGEACASDVQCASGACAGTPVGFCDDWGLWPCYVDGECPVEGDLSPGTCTFMAVAGGTCQ